MVSDRVTIYVDVNTKEAEADIETIKAKADAVVKDWRLKRVEIIQGIREAITLVSTAYSTFRQFMSIVGAQIDPFYSALIGMTLSTVSMMLSVSAALAATGVGLGAAVIIGGIATVLNAYMLGKLIEDKARTMGMFDPTTWHPQTDVTPYRGGF